VISSRHKTREEVEAEGTDCSDRFPAFSARFNSYKYPECFKPIGITKYDGKQAPQQWLRCYSTAIEVAGGSNITKVVYFPMALDPAPLTWLESLGSNSIDSWERLKKVFIDNFQGAITRADTRHYLAQCKQERNELLRSYTRRFFDVRATIANISEDDIIDCFYNGITDPGIYRDFGRNRSKTVAGLYDMMHDWSEQEEKMRERFPRRQDSNLRRLNDNRSDKGQRDFSGPPWAPAMLPSTAITFGGRSAIPVAERRTRSLLIKNPRMMIKRIMGATRSFRTRQRLSTSSLGETRIFVPGGIRSCSSGRFCPSSRRYHDHSVCGRTNLNYTGSSTRVHSRGLQRASIGIIPWPVG
jgi:hypothetical protein